MTYRPLTDEELSEIESRADSATLGPWRADTVDPEDVVIWGSELNPKTGDANFLGNVGSSRFTEVGVAFDIDTANAQFIAASRTDVPRLVAEIRALRSKISGK